jgi:uncharacterized damage-inducible protein DinB
VNETLIWTLQKAREQTLNLVEDLREEQMRVQSAAGENHPAWILGHILLGDVYLLSLLKVREFSADDFDDLLKKYFPAPKPVSSAEFYDSKQILVERLQQTNALRLEAIRRMTREDLAQATPDATLARAQPTVEHHLFALAAHEAHHGGQLAAWRKAQGLKPIKWSFAP